MHGRARFALFSSLSAFSLIMLITPKAAAAGTSSGHSQGVLLACDDPHCSDPSTTLGTHWMVKAVLSTAVKTGEPTNVSQPSPSFTSAAMFCQGHEAAARGRAWATRGTRGSACGQRIGPGSGPIGGCRRLRRLAGWRAQRCACCCMADPVFCHRPVRMIAHHGSGQTEGTAPAELWPEPRPSWRPGSTPLERRCCQTR